MKIEFLTQDDSLYILPFFVEFFRKYSSHFEITMLSSTRVMGKRPRAKLLLDMLWLYGVVGLTRLAARLIWFKLLALTRPKPNAEQYYSLRQLCQAFSVPYQTVENPNEPNFISELKCRESDVLVSIACPYILKKAILTTPSRGCINLHHSPLPRYKGMMPTFWQLYHGEKYVGVTVHYMAEKVDEGDALLQEKLEVLPRESLDRLIRRSKQYAAHCVARVLHQIKSNEAVATAFDKTQGSYATFPERHHMREFHRRGLRAI